MNINVSMWGFMSLYVLECDSAVERYWSARLTIRSGRYPPPDRLPSSCMYDWRNTHDT